MLFILTKGSLFVASVPIIINTEQCSSSHAATFVCRVVAVSASFTMDGKSESARVRDDEKGTTRDNTALYGTRIGETNRQAHIHILHVPVAYREKIRVWSVVEAVSGIFSAVHPTQCRYLIPVESASTIQKQKDSSKRQCPKGKKDRMAKHHFTPTSDNKSTLPTTWVLSPPSCPNNRKIRNWSSVNSL